MFTDPSVALLIGDVMPGDQAGRTTPEGGEPDGAGTGADVIDTMDRGERIALVDVSSALFAGFAPAGPLASPTVIESFRQFADTFGAGVNGPFMASATLAHAVRGFFRNGGTRCTVMRLTGEPGSGQLSGPESEAMFAADCSVIAVPDLHGLVDDLEASAGLQHELVRRAEETNRFVLLDPPAELSPEDVVRWRRRLRLDTPCAVTYYPWVDAPGYLAGQPVAVPPSGHVIGLWARLDATEGVHHAPTGQPILGIDQPVTALTANEQRVLNREGINCLRLFPGPEPRVWGARTLSSDPDWRYLQRRRTQLQLISSIARGLDWVSGAPLGEETVNRLQAAVSVFLQTAWRQGVLQGASTGQAFSLACEPSESRPGHLALELGLALRQPAEFRVTRLLLHTAAAR